MHMVETVRDDRRSRRVLYGATVVVTALATAGIMYLWQNITERRREAEETVFRVVPLDRHTIDPAEWGKNYPRQYDSYLRTVDIARTRYGGSEAFQRLDEFPVYRTLFAGYPFSADYREERGHAYMLRDQEQTERVKKFKQYGACLHCHASILPAYESAGRKAGVPDERLDEQIQKGFEEVCAMPYQEARHLKDDKGELLIQHPVACIDCHDPDSMQLRVTRPGLLNALVELAQADIDYPHLPSLSRWRKERRGENARYNPNTEASRQEMRTLVCAQCHVEYYFKGDEKRLTYPWHNGLKIEQAEKYYDDQGYKDWVHEVTGAPLLKAQHPEFELWSQGIHARSGVACADCHMPYVREGAIKISDHHVRSPLLDAQSIARACQTCHRYGEDEIRSRAQSIQDRTRSLMARAETAVVDLVHTIDNARKQGATDETLAKALDFHRKAEWRLDYVAAENSMGFHASQESARILGEAADLARQGQIETLKSISGDVTKAVQPPEGFEPKPVQHPIYQPPLRPAKPPLVPTETDKSGK
jgi:nitrite reductase (cytochrome c-552)